MTAELENDIQIQEHGCKICGSRIGLTNLKKMTEKGIIEDSLICWACQLGED